MRATVALGARSTAWRLARIRAFPTWSASADARCRSTPREVEDLVAYQIGALAAIAAAQGVRLQHVKPHGALYNMAARERRAGGRDRARHARGGSVARAVRVGRLGADARGRATQALRTASRGVRRSRAIGRRRAGAARRPRRRGLTTRTRSWPAPWRWCGTQAVDAVDGTRVPLDGATRSASTATRPERLSWRGACAQPCTMRASRCGRRRAERSAKTRARPADCRQHPPQDLARPSSSAAPSGTRRCAGTL